MLCPQTDILWHILKSTLKPTVCSMLFPKLENIKASLVLGLFIYVIQQSNSPKRWSVAKISSERSSYFSTDSLPSTEQHGQIHSTATSNTCFLDVFGCSILD
jgi:hypothetical protein